MALHGCTGFRYAPLGVGSIVRHPTPAALRPHHCGPTHPPSVTPPKDAVSRPIALGWSYYSPGMLCSNLVDTTLGLSHCVSFVTGRRKFLLGVRVCRILIRVYLGVSVVGPVLRFPLSISRAGCDEDLLFIFRMTQTTTIILALPP